MLSNEEAQAIRKHADFNQWVQLFNWPPPLSRSYYIAEWPALLVISLLISRHVSNSIH